MTKLKIEKMYAFVAENDEGEGVMAFKSSNTWMPMVGADFKRIDSLLSIAQEMSKVSGQKFRILQFDNRKDVTEQFIRKIKIEE